MYSRAICQAIIVSSLIYESLAIYCYDCNSANNTACLDVNMYEEEVRSRIIPIIECNLGTPSSIAPNFFCRKIVQTIFHPHKDSEVRVTRSCGWKRHDKECYKDDNSDHLGTVCQCFTDMCNAGDNVDPSTMTGLFLLLTACLYLWR